MEELPKIDTYLVKLGKFLKDRADMYEDEPQLLSEFLFKLECCLALRKEIHDHIGDFERTLHNLPLGTLAKICINLKLAVGDEKEARKRLKQIYLEQNTVDWTEPDRCPHDVETLEKIRIALAELDQLKKRINDRSKNPGN
jgi:hypothetical protein